MPIKNECQREAERAVTARAGRGRAPGRAGAAWPACANLRYAQADRRCGPGRRAIGSAGERLVHTEEVTGSIPVSPTQLSGRFPAGFSCPGGGRASRAVMRPGQRRLAPGRPVVHAGSSGNGRDVRRRIVKTAIVLLAMGSRTSSGPPSPDGAKPARSWPPRRCRCRFTFRRFPAGAASICCAGCSSRCAGSSRHRRRRPARAHPRPGTQRRSVHRRLPALLLADRRPGGNPRCSFQLLATEAAAHHERPHAWHLDLADRLVAADPELVAPTRRIAVDTTVPASVDAGTGWWSELTAGGSEGIVVKSAGNLTRGRKGLVVPAYGNVH